MAFERTVTVYPAYDKRSPVPSENYGIGACLIVFILKGDKGAVQFMIGTDWHLPSVQRENREWQQDFDRRFDKIKPDGYDVGYHSPKPMYEGHEPTKDHCHVIGSECFYDGSGLMADDWVPEFIAGGTEWLWPRLEEYYRSQFDKNEE